MPDIRSPMSNETPETIAEQIVTFLADTLSGGSDLAFRHTMDHDGPRSQPNDEDGTIVWINLPIGDPDERGYVEGESFTDAMVDFIRRSGTPVAVAELDVARSSGEAAPTNPCVVFGCECPECASPSGSPTTPAGDREAAFLAGASFVAGEDSHGASVFEAAAKYASGSPTAGGEEAWRLDQNDEPMEEATALINRLLFAQTAFVTFSGGEGEALDRVVNELHQAEEGLRERLNLSIGLYFERECIRQAKIIDTLKARLRSLSSSGSPASPLSEEEAMAMIFEHEAASIRANDFPSVGNLARLRTAVAELLDRLSRSPGDKESEQPKLRQVQPHTVGSAYLCGRCAKSHVVGCGPDGLVGGKPCPNVAGSEEGKR